MNKDLSFQQAKLLRDYLQNSSGASVSNVEVLSGLVLLFSRLYLDLIISEMEKK